MEDEYEIPFLIFLIAIVSPAQAHLLRCGSRDVIVPYLESHYKEMRQGAAVSTGSELIEIFTSDKGTWTITATNAQRLTCIMAVGDDWQNIKKKLTGDDS